MPHSFLALGDSYTIGELVITEERWTYQLRTILQKSTVLLDEPLTIATTGWTTDELLTAINEKHILGKFDFVSLLIGVNNQYRGRTIENYAAEFETLLKLAISFAGNKNEKVVVVSIPDWGITPFATAHGRDEKTVSHEIDLFNATAETICKKYRVAFVNITPISRNKDLSLLATDHLHPSGKQYGLWAAAIAPIVMAMFSQHKN